MRPAQHLNASFFVVGSDDSRVNADRYILKYSGSSIINAISLETEDAHKSADGKQTKQGKLPVQTRTDKLTCLACQRSRWQRQSAGYRLDLEGVRDLQEARFYLIDLKQELAEFLAEK